MNNKYVVSFCVPVYNRAEVSYLLAKDLLQNPDDRFQVVISDNNSSDNTIELLKTLKDERLKVCTNQDKDCPPTINWYNSLENGDGEFLYLVMGRDRLYWENISVLIELLIQLRDKNVGFARDRGNKNEYDIYSKRGAAIKFLDRDHPTGIIFNNSLWKDINNRKDFFCIKDFYYPENYIKGELLKKANAVLISSGVFSINDEGYRIYIDKRKDKSKLVTNKKNCWIFPKNNLKYLIRNIGIINELGFSEEEEKEIFSRQYSKYLRIGIISYKVDRENEEACSHYSIRPRKVFKYELILALMKWHISFCYYMKKKSWYDAKYKKQIDELSKKCLENIGELYH